MCPCCVLHENLLNKQTRSITCVLSVANHAVLYTTEFPIADLLRKDFITWLYYPHSQIASTKDNTGHTSHGWTQVNTSLQSTVNNEKQYILPPFLHQIFSSIRRAKSTSTTNQPMPRIPRNRILIPQCFHCTLIWILPAFTLCKNQCPSIDCTFHCTSLPFETI